MGTELCNVAQAFQQRRQGNRSVLSYREYTQKQCDYLNATPGHLTGYDCAICKNKGVVYFVGDDDEIRAKPCQCREIRNSMKRIQSSGLETLLNRYTFESFQTDMLLQKKMKHTALEFLEDCDGKWFFAGGQSGAGKTHICTAIAGELLRRGKSVRYMLWNDESVRIKAAIHDEFEYAKLIDPLKRVSVLYIDDLFKPVQNDTGERKQPNPGDIRLAFELLNFRYIHPNLITIISSEWTMDELQDIDPAIGGRVYQRSKDYCLTISHDESKNYRLRDAL
ncbi:MAG: IstB-IS21 domain-containing protein [Eubacteriales bacterium]|jgi:DNA replication protein DnaC